MVRSLTATLLCLYMYHLSGCVTATVEGESTSQMKKKVTASHFYRQAALLYPGKEIEDPTEIPPLNPEDLDSMQRDLDRTLESVLHLHQQHYDIVRIFLGDEAAELPKATVLVTNRDLPEAQTVSSGEITIDVRVLQSLLRAALVTAYQTEIWLHRIETGAESSAHDFSPEEEKLAINTFLAKRTRFDQTPARSVIGDLKATDVRRKPVSGPLDWSQMRDVLGEFNAIEVRYATEKLFLVAHEVGHVTLGHFGPNPLGVTDKENDLEEDDCSSRRALERAADVYASILITWATPRNAADDFLGLLGGTKVVEGFDTFFSYAYDYAGFTSTGSNQKCVNYPPPAQRSEFVRLIYDIIREGQIDAIIDASDRGS